MAAALVGGYGLMANVVLPRAWTHYERQQGLAGLPMVSRTAQNIPGDPLSRPRRITMVRKISKSGAPYHEPPYTDEEETDIYRRAAAGPVTVYRTNASFRPIPATKAGNRRNRPFPRRLSTRSIQLDATQGVRWKTYVASRSLMTSTTASSRMGF